MTKAEYNAISVAMDMMNVYLDNGGSDESGEVDKALSVLVQMNKKEEIKRAKAIKKKLLSDMIDAIPKNDSFFAATKMVLIEEKGLEASSNELTAFGEELELFDK